MILLTPTAWDDYELIDTGDGEKIERFGNYVLRRPEPQAVWEKALSEKIGKAKLTLILSAKKTSKTNRKRENGK